MHYKYLGQTGIQVSGLSLGTMTFGGESDEKTSAEIYRICRHAGINLFDCADVYQEGRSEEILGKLIQHERHEIILTSKTYFPFGKELNSKGLSRRHIFHSIESSLKRLKTDRIDIYFMHRFDESTPLEDSLRAMQDLVTQGKVLYLGVSNFAAWQIMKALGISKMNRWPAIQVLQPMYNLVKRQSEVEIFPLALSEKLGVLSYNPLAGGLLTGKYTSGKSEPGMRFYERQLYQMRYQDAIARETTQRFIDFAHRRGDSPVALAIAWAAAHPAVTSPLLGCRNAEQLNTCLKAIEIAMTPELHAEISSLSIEPAPATDRSEERLDDTTIPAK